MNGARARAARRPRHAGSKAEQYGEKHAAEFVAEHADLVMRLIGHYADRDAETLLNDLRELFWSGDWTPRKAPTS